MCDWSASAFPDHRPLFNLWYVSGKFPESDRIAEEFPPEKWHCVTAELIYLLLCVENGCTDRWYTYEPFFCPCKYPESQLVAYSKSAIDDMITKNVDPLSPVKCYMTIEKECCFTLALKLKDQSIARRLWALCRFDENLDTRLLSLKSSYFDYRDYFEYLVRSYSCKQFPFRLHINNAIRLGLPFRWFDSEPPYLLASPFWRPIYYAATEHWSLARHPSFAPVSQKAIFTLLCCAKRTKPRLPPKIWLLILEHTRRCDWVPQDLAEI